MSRRSDDGSGCALFLGGLLVLGAIVAGVAAIASLVDPFDWVPPIGDVFASCALDAHNEPSGCGLGEEHPGFWGHVILNLLWVIVTAGVLLGLAQTVADLREARAARFSREAAVEQYREARQTVAAAVAVAAILAVIPIVAAVA